MAPRPLGDTHNFGRRVTTHGKLVRKPRTLFWEQLVLSAKSPLRRVLRAIGDFDFLPDLAFRRGAVEKLSLDPLPKKTDELELARVVGKFMALFAWLGVSDLHWENLALGWDGRVILTPLDIEMILSDFASPVYTRLIPEADPEYAASYRHACGVRRALPWLGKPVSAAALRAIVGAYDETLALLDRHARAIADVFAALPKLRETPIRVTLRGTDEYVHANASTWPPLLFAEREQMDRGDIPYFFRLYGRAGIHWFSEPSLREWKTLPRKGDVPQLEPLLSIARGLRSPSRMKLHEEGAMALLEAFDADHGTAYLPCRCGEVRTVLVPRVTRCSG